MDFLIAMVAPALILLVVLVSGRLLLTLGIGVALRLVRHLLQKEAS